MAHQLHYTSAASGLADRAGFQFVAASPGATPAMQQAVSRLLAYRPPPSAPTRPSPAQLRDFPVSFGFERTEAGLALVRCRYLGADYSGRFGNFIGHAVVASVQELEGLHPIELWEAPWWATEPGGPRLPDLAALPPGPVTDPSSVGQWLRANGSTGLLARLIDATLATLDGAAEPVVLVSQSMDTIARWMAAVSFSVPRSRVWDLSFVTYTADPDRVRHHLIGTTPDCLGFSHGQMFQLDEHPSAASAAPSRYAQAVAAAWDRGDLAAIDTIDELVASVPPQDREAAAIVAAASAGLPLMEPETLAAVDLIGRSARQLPASLWSGFTEDLDLPMAFALHGAAVELRHTELLDRVAPVCVRLALPHRAERRRLKAISSVKHDVAPVMAAVLRRVADLPELAELMQIGRRLGIPIDPAALTIASGRAVRSGKGTLDSVLDDEALRDGVIAGAIVGLTDAEGPLIERMLTDAFCAYSADRDWTNAPRVGMRVLRDYGCKHPDRRVGISDALVDLADRNLVSGNDIDICLDKIWRTPEPTVAECLALFGGRGVLTLERARRRPILALAGRALATGAGGDEAFVLAQRLLTLDPEAPEAHGVVAMHRLSHHDLLQGCLSLEKTGSTKSHRDALALAVSDFLAAKPAAQAELIAALAGAARVRKELVSALLSTRGRAAEHAVVEVAVRLLKAGRPEAAINARAVKFIRRPGEAALMSEKLKARDRSLPPYLDELLAGKHGGLWGRLFGRGDER